MEGRAELLEKWRPPAIFFISVSSSHFSPSFSASALCLFPIPHFTCFQLVPLLTLLFSFTFPSFLSAFSCCTPSAIYILSLPFSSSALANSLNTHTYPSALMACVQRMQLAKPRASAEIDEYYWYSFTGCVCASCTGFLCCVCMPVSVSVAIDCWRMQSLSVCLWMNVHV